MAWVCEHQGMLNPSLSNLQSHIWALVWGLRTCLFSRQRYTKWSHPTCGTLCLKSKLKSNMISEVFPVVMYGSESWTIKKAECQRIDAFKLWCWRRLLRVPLDCKEIQPYGYLIFEKRGKNIQWGKTASSINGAGKTGQLHVKEWN